MQTKQNRTTRCAAITLLAMLATGCGSGGGGSGGNPSPEPSVNGYWQVVAQQILSRNDPALQPIPVGSIMTIVDEQLVRVDLAGTSITWLTDEDSIEAQVGRGVAYSNEWDVPIMSGGSGPAGRGLDYGWDELGLADALRETLEILAFDGTTMSISHHYEYQPNLSSPSVFMDTGYFIEYIGEVAPVGQATAPQGTLTLDSESRGPSSLVEERLPR